MIKEPIPFLGWLEEDKMLPEKNIIEAQGRLLKQYSEELEAAHNLIKEQDKKIIELAFELEYVKRSNELLHEESKK